jgi:hypothetical protein
LIKCFILIDSSQTGLIRSIIGSNVPHYTRGVALIKRELL